MTKNSKSFGRKAPSLDQMPTVLVLCEDSKASLTYLKEAAQHFRARATIKIAHKDTCPRKSVQFSISESKSFDEIYCFIDRDDHEHFDAALTLAKTKENIHIIASYPCFEFWLLLHFKKVRKSYSKGKVGSDEVLADLRQHDDMKNYAKGDTKNLFKKLEGKLEVAKNNAEWALKEAKKDNENNPSTSTHILLTRFEALGTLG
jgi:hypothetical protein